MTLRLLLRFFAIGTLCCVGERALRSEAPPSAPSCARSGANCDDETLLADAARRLGLHEHDEVVRRRLVANLRALGAASDTSDRLLLNEAYALGMHESDPVVRRRLANLLRLRITSETIARDARDRAMRIPPDVWKASPAFESSGARFESNGSTPERVTLQHVFFDSAKRGASARSAARALASILRNEADSAARTDRRSGSFDAPALGAGDPHLASAQMGPASRASLARFFGVAIASAAFETPVGVWRGPLPSAAGWHLLRVVARETAAQEAPGMRQARQQHAMLQARIDERIREVVDALRSRAGADR